MKPMLIAMMVLVCAPLAAFAAGGEATLPQRPTLSGTECIFQTGPCADLELRRIH